MLGTSDLPAPRLLWPRGLESLHQVPRELLPTYPVALVETMKRLELSWVLAVGTPSTWSIAAHARDLPPRLLAGLPSREAVESAADKRRCRGICRSLGIPTPAEVTHDEAIGLLAGQPRVDRLVVKPAWDVGGARGVSYVGTPEELGVALSRCARKGWPPTIEEYVPGGPGSMYTVVLLFGPGARLIAAFTARKLRELPPSGGITVCSESIADEALVRGVLPFFEAVGWCGPAEVELKRDPRDGIAKVIEINPRFPGYLRFASSCGLDLVRLAERLTREPEHPSLPFPSYALGRRYLAPRDFTRSVLTPSSPGPGLPARLPAPGLLLRELRGTGLWITDFLADPGPAVARAVFRA